jgi:glycosyltransferase involved in cell wall biosynthesis
VPEITDGSAVLVDGESPEDIANAVRRLLDNETERTQFGNLARHRATQTYPFENRKRGLAEVIEQFIISKRR